MFKESIIGFNKRSKNNGSAGLRIFSLLEWGMVVCACFALEVVFFSCNKPDGPYYDYVNKVHIFDGNSLEFLQSQNGVYDSLLLVIDRLPDIKDSIEQDSVTLVAATNRSFETAIKNLNALRQVQGKAPLYLASVDSAQLDTIMARYVLRGKITTDYVSQYVDGISGFGIKYATEINLQYKKTSADGANLSGPQLLYISDMKGSPYTDNWVRSTTASVNLYTNNGVIHTLVPNHEFGFGEFSIRLNK
jgi:hypothetical protein